jgi:glutathione S-transferase
MHAWSLDNPLFRAYLVSAAIMVVKTMGMAWLTVYRMLRVDAGYRSPEDARAGMINKQPRPGQLEPNEYVDRIRRIHHNDLENIPLFLVAGLLFVATRPPLVVGTALLYGYVATRLAHFAVYVSARSHEARATMWTLGSLIVLAMVGATAWSALTW